MISVLIVDDEIGVRQSLKMLLKKEYEVFLAEKAEEAFSQIKEHSPKVILLDITLPDLDGFKVLERIKQDHPDTIVIVMTGSIMTDEMVLEVDKFKAYGYVSKPFDINELRLMITQSLATKA
jgi:DNA-binding NtrC family response regulator